MMWIPFALSAWLLCSVALAVFMGMSIQVADRRADTSRRAEPDLLVRPEAPDVRVPALQA